MTLSSNWQAVLTRAWSVRFIALAIALSGLEVTIPMLEGVLPIPQGTFAAFAGLISAGALFARVVAQSDIPAKKEEAADVDYSQAQ